MKKITITTPDSTRSIGTTATTLAQALIEAGYPLNARCQCRGTCRACTLIVNGAEVLACQTAPTEGMKVTIPTRSLIAQDHAIVSDYQTQITPTHAPYFPDSTYAIAIDIGTTTVAAQLIETSSGKICARATRINAQIRHGDNVLTRIQLCQSDKTQIQKLHDALWLDTIAPVWADLVSALSPALPPSTGAAAGTLAVPRSVPPFLPSAGAAAQAEAAPRSVPPLPPSAGVSGNTTMLHLAAGIDPTSLGTSPFTPSFLELRKIKSPIPELSEVVLLPSLAAYVGSDIVAGAVCCGMHKCAAPQLLIDIGTNGEILLATPTGNLSCATAAGPAFEGNGLACGARAAAGVVERIAICQKTLDVQTVLVASKSSPKPQITIPIGIAGSAYIDFLAEARACGLLEASGRYSSSIVEKFPSHFRRDASGLAFLLLPEIAPDLRISEADIAALIQAKAAIAAGIETLLRIVGITHTALERVWLAGGFGLHISIPHAIACGLLPGFQPAQITPVGNTSLGGATLALLDSTLATAMQTLKTRTIELNTDPDFEDTYLDHLHI